MIPHTSGKGTKMLLRAVLAGRRRGGWNGFLLSKSKGTDIQCRFSGARVVMGTFSGRVSFRRWRISGKAGWLPGLSSRTFRAPWAITASDLACNSLATAPGSYPLLSGSS